MAKKDPAPRTSATVDEMLLAALERGDDSFQTGRYLATFKEGATASGVAALSGSSGVRVADARDFDPRRAFVEDIGDAGAVVFPEIGVALIGGPEAQERGMTSVASLASDSAIESID